ncbi:CAP domain-containing protein [Candidatus Uhrbacteria bacterium]|nr:CAP domain-containing protein [Candidatus Uhrbacteria bacterium]
MRTRFALVIFALLVYTALFGAGWILGGRAGQKHSRYWSGTLSSAAPLEHAIPDTNRYWLEKINELRKQKNVRLLAVDPRLIQTAADWADEMKTRGEITHTRTDGKTMHEWIGTKNISFTKQGAPNGWKSNYFVENIARYYAEPTDSGLNTALDKVLAEFVAEGPGGDHYESIYHPDWNSVGVGHAYEPAEHGNVRVYFVFHYGSLER